MGENDENKPNEQGQLPSYEQSIQIPEDDKPELPPAYRFVEYFEQRSTSRRHPRRTGFRKSLFPLWDY